MLINELDSVLCKCFEIDIKGPYDTDIPRPILPNNSLFLRLVPVLLNLKARMTLAVSVIWGLVSTISQLSSLMSHVSFHSLKYHTH